MQRNPAAKVAEKGAVVIGLVLMLGCGPLDDDALSFGPNQGKGDGDGVAPQTCSAVVEQELRVANTPTGVHCSGGCPFEPGASVACYRSAGVVPKWRCRTSFGDGIKQHLFHAMWESCRRPAPVAAEVLDQAPDALTCDEAPECAGTCATDANVPVKCYRPLALNRKWICLTSDREGVSANSWYAAALEACPKPGDAQ